MSARILFIDIETAPCIGYTWGVWEQNVLDVIQSWYILSFAYKWKGQKRTHWRGLPDFKKRYTKKPTDDYKICKELHALLNEADIVIAHNGDNFDLKKINARLIFHGFDPPSTYKSIDTLKIARSKFAFLSNKLDALAKYFKVGKKIAHTGFHLWHACMSGDLKAWKIMKRYNIHDVDLLEKIYYKLAPWYPSHPDINLFSDKRGHYCPVCSSSRVQRRGIRVAIKRRYQRFQCFNCGAWFSGKLVK